MRAIEQLKAFNKWCIGADLPKSDSKTVYESIDRVIEEHEILLETLKMFVEAREVQIVSRSNGNIKMGIAKSRANKVIKAIEENTSFRNI